MITADRLKEVVNYLRYSEFVKTQKDIADALEISPSTLSSALNGLDKYLTAGLVDKLCTKFQRLNRQWLLTGEGSMLIAGFSNNSGTISQSMGDTHGGGTHGSHNTTTTTTYNGCASADDTPNNLAAALAEIAEQRKLTERVVAQMERLIDMLAAHK